MKKIIAISGSLRRNSLNSELIEAITKKFDPLIIETFITPHHKLELPLFNQDLENPAQDLLEYKQLLMNCDGMLIASPEYNGSISGALKNLIDWLSRGSNPFAGKKVCLVSASPSPFGGMRGMMHLRDIMLQLGSIVYPGNLCLCKNDNSSYSEAQLKLIQGISDGFTRFIGS